MAETTKIRIALQGARELDLEVDDAVELQSSISAAIEAGSGIVWVTDSKGNQHGLLVDKLAFVEIDAPQAKPGVGFGTGE